MSKRAMYVGFDQAPPRRGMWSLVRRHFKKILLVPLVSMGLGLAVIFFFPRTYRSEAKLFLQVGHETIGLDPMATTGQTVGYLQNGREDEIKSAIELMTSRAVITDVVADLTPEYVLGKVGPGAAAKKANPAGQAVKKVIGTAVKWIKDIDPITPEEEARSSRLRRTWSRRPSGSAIVVVTYDAPSPELAQAVLEKLMDVYLREHLRVHRNQDSLKFFVQQQESLRTLMDDTAQQVLDAKNRMGLASIDGRRGSLEQQLHTVESANYQAEQDKASTQARIKAINHQLDDEPESLVASRRMVPNSGADLMREQLYALRVREKDLQSRYSVDHPLLAAIQRQVAEAEQLVDLEDGERPETTNRLNEIRQSLLLELKQLQSQLAGINSRLVALADQTANVKADLMELNKNEVMVVQLQLEENVARSKWLKYTDNLEQARIDQQREESRVSNVSMAQAATLAHKPVVPSKALVLLASMMLAVGGTTVLILGSERMEAAQSAEHAVAEKRAAALADDLLDVAPPMRAPSPK